MDLRKMDNVVRLPLDIGGSLTIRDCFLDVDYIWYQFDTQESATQSPVYHDSDQNPYFEVGEEKYYIREFR